ncbi:NAD(+) hydrolase sarm1-like [Planococcus citri]|uniref:NAD(+) hydrolase sarm1-like n=1 Tax=Planococcus citri TaxID=170843 RepID=UPI0031F8A6F5
MDFPHVDHMIHDHHRLVIRQALVQVNHSRNEVNKMTDYLAQFAEIVDKFSENIDEPNPNVEMATQTASKLLTDIVQSLNESVVQASEVAKIHGKMSDLMIKAWSIPTYGYEFGHRLCETMRDYGGLSYLISCSESKYEGVRFSSAKLLEQCLTPGNRAYVVEHGLEKVVRGICSTKNSSSQDQSRVRTGILEHLFKHSESTCEDITRYGGLQVILDDCRKNDIPTLRNCAKALVNLSLYGGAENQQVMIKHKVSLWLFPLAFHDDDVVKYYACLAISILVTIKELEGDVLKSGTLKLVEPFIMNHDPVEFIVSNRSHILSQSKNWLSRLIPVLNSNRKESRNLAAFHFCLEAGIRKSLRNEEAATGGMFREIGAVIYLKKIASGPCNTGAKLAAEALKLMGEDLPHKLIKQVPSWSPEDVQNWITQVGFSELVSKFEENRIDGDLLLRMTEESLDKDLQMTNGIQRQRFIRELQNLKKIADYGSHDQDDLNEFLRRINPDFTIYTYGMLIAGVNKTSIRNISASQLSRDCAIKNSIHVSQILEAIKAKLDLEEQNPSKLDVFLCYRRAGGSNLASLLKCHLSSLGYSVFLDVYDLKSGKFDVNLLQKIEQSKNFVLVLTPQSLDRCIGDDGCEDWVHREFVAAKQYKCNIIPIIDAEFLWPKTDELPEDMRDVCFFNAIQWNHLNQKGVVEKLQTFLK